MPLPGKRWRHAIVGTFNSWLPGDKRGFRSRDHKIHSSGDYKNPPPIEEHAGLRAYHQERAGEPVIIPRDVREKIGLALVDFFKKENHRLLAVAVAGMHGHMLVELPEDIKSVKVIVGKAKRKASLKVIKDMPGRVWGVGGNFEPVDDEQHQRNTYNYIWDKQRDAWVWSFKEGSRYND